MDKMLVYKLEKFEDFGLEIELNRYLNKYGKIYEYKRSRSFFDF